MRTEFTDKRTSIIAVSGGFDFLHYGHVRYIQDAARFGDVIVILNSDSWLMRKKGYVVQLWEQRAEILHAIKGVKDVIMAADDDDTVSKTLRILYPDYFAKGGDRTNDNTPELEVCIELGINMLWNMGGNKIASSQKLINAIR